jgi:cyclic pyranopterin phosphate synthase
MKGFNDDEIEDFAKLTIDKDIIIRFIELMPFGERYSWTKDKYLSNSRVLEKVKNLEEINYDKGSPSRYYKIKGAKGKIGLINPISRHFCNTCNRIRLTADGNIKPCLHSDLEIDMKKYLGSEEEIYKGLIEAVKSKPSQHHINEEGYDPIKRDMNRIGG